MFAYWPHRPKISIHVLIGTYHMCLLWQTYSCSMVNQFFSYGSVRLSRHLFAFYGIYPPWRHKESPFTAQIRLPCIQSLSTAHIHLSRKKSHLLRYRFALHDTYSSLLSYIDFYSKQFCLLQHKFAFYGTYFPSPAKNRLLRYMSAFLHKELPSMTQIRVLRIHSTSRHIFTFHCTQIHLLWHIPPLRPILVSHGTTIAFDGTRLPFYGINSPYIFAFIA